tara:strand:- start:4715 stop:8794 length:4080 start_codon:yes stop_codon:yes gene_type:complete
MPTVLQHRRGTAAQNNAFTGSSGELTVDLTNGTIRVHDGSTAGGKRLATKDSADAALAAAQGLDSANVVAIIDSDYVLARAPAQDFLDSAEAIDLIDSSYVRARQDKAYSSLTGSPTIPTLGTSFVDSSEARKVISVTDTGGDGSLSYNNSTGVLTFTGPSASDTRAHFTAGEGIDISSGEISGEDATTTNKGIASFATANFTVASGAVSLKTDGINDTHIDFGTGTNQVSTADLPEETNLYFTESRAKSAAVADAINNGTTDVAPSQNAVFDALALKLNASAVPTLSVDFIDSAEAVKLIDSSYVQARQSGGEITIQDEGSALSTAATTLNFVGSGVTASGSGTTKTITISGGGGSGTVDSAAVIALLDSSTRTFFGSIQVTNDASNGQSGQAEVQANTTRDTINLVGGAGLAITTNASEDRITFTPVNQFDSAETIALIDSDYVLARAPAQTTADFPDSAGVNTLIDARVTLSYGKSLGFLDSAEIVQAAKDAITKPYIQAFDFLDSGEVVTAANAAIDSKVNASYVNALNIIPTFGTDFVDSAFVTSQINNLVDAAPGALNTLNELAAAIGDDANFSTTVTNSIAAKLDSAQTIALIDSSYVQARQSATGGTDPIFKTIAVAGQDNIVADTTTDTLTVVGSTGITVTTNASSDTLTFATTDGDIVHDNLSGFVANEHIDHTSVSIATGTGLSGGGTIASTRTLKIDSSELATLYSKVIVHDNTNGFVANEHVDHSGVSIIAGKGLSGGGTIASSRTIDIDSSNVRGMFSGGTGITYNSGTGAISTTDGEIVHDNLSGFVANEHIDHSGVSITAGNGLKGGGTIASNRDLAIDSAELLSLYEASLRHDNLSGFVANEHIDHSGVSIVAGKGLSGGGTIASSRTINIDSANVRGMFSGGTGITYNSSTGAISSTDADIVHDNLSGFVANEHIDHTSVSIATGTGLSGGGTIASTRTLKIDSSDLASLYSKVIVHDNTNGFVANEHIDHSGVSIIAGNGLSGGGTIASSRTINIDSGNVDVMIDSNLAGSSVTIDGNGSTGGVILSDGNIDIRSGTGNVSKIKFYCEVNNAHAQTLQAQPHSAGSSAVIVLPVASGTLLNDDGSGASLTNLNGSQVTSGTVAAARIDNLAASKINSGTFDSARIPAIQINANRINSGTIDSARLPAGTFGGGGGGSSLTVADEGSDLSTAATKLDFVGAGVTASGTGATKTITIAGGGSGVTVQDEGSALSTAATTINFVGAGVTATGSGATKTVTISGGGGGAGLDNIFAYTATNNQTSFSGNDKNGNSLSYTAGDILVYLNGILLSDSDDYTASNGSAVVLTSGASANDELTVSTFAAAASGVSTGKAIAMAIVFGG